ncbi:hypothetical protein [Pseudoflavonifractor intestinihominis]|uniref:Uncharacterized protein n=1 Tax=Pseudoflavonifractor intestinihominis TaxID=3133171 RepID=A0ABV1EB46_9FIRM|nr:hypothetical protein [uncultured Pseudoflavonifractor sp.]
MKKLVMGGACVVWGVLLTVLMEAGEIAGTGIWAAAMALLLISAGLLLEILGLREH